MGSSGYTYASAIILSVKKYSLFVLFMVSLYIIYGLESSKLKVT